MLCGNNLHNTTFDTLGRVQKVTAPDGGVPLFANTFFETYVLDADARLAHEQRDVDGRVVATSCYEGPRRHKMLFGLE